MIEPLAGASRRARRFGAPKNWRATFLARLAETSNVTQAAAVAKISTGWVYKTRREDRGFARAWQMALAEGYDNLEMELLQRLRAGEGKDPEGRKFDNATAFRLLMAHRESAARERALREDEDEEAVLASLNAKLDALRERLLAGDGADDDA